MQETRLAIYNHLKSNPNSTVKQVMHAVGLKSLSAVQHHLMQLVGSGHIKQGNKWEILK